MPKPPLDPLQRNLEQVIHKIQRITQVQPEIFPDSFADGWRKIIRPTSIVLIIGKRGSGKSALGFYLLEVLRSRGHSCVVGFPRRSAHLLPPWCRNVARLEDAPEGSVTLLDETYTAYMARGSQSSQSKKLLNILGMSRKKKQLLLFVAHQSSQIDVDIARHIDVIVIKQPTLLQIGLDRPVLRDILSKARNSFEQIRGDKRKYSYVISDIAGFEGMIENNLPSFWTEEISMAFVENE